MLHYVRSICRCFYSSEKVLSLRWLVYNRLNQPMLRRIQRNCLTEWIINWRGMVVTETHVLNLPLAQLNQCSRWRITRVQHKVRHRLLLVFNHDIWPICELISIILLHNWYLQESILICINSYQKPVISLLTKVSIKDCCNWACLCALPQIVGFVCKSPLIYIHFKCF